MHNKVTIFLFLVLLLISQVAALAADVKLAWDPNTEPELKGYYVHYGTASGDYTQQEDAGNQTTYTVTGLDEGTAYYFAITAYSDTVESDYSDEISHTVPVPVVTYTLTASAGANGSIDPSGTITVNQNTSQTFTITPAANYHVADVRVDGASVGAVTSYTFSNVTTNHTIEANFAIDSYSISATAGENGAISPAGSVTVNAGDSQAFTITPAANCHVADVKADGTSVGAVTSYTFNNITANHSISASFEQNAPISYTITATAGTGGAISPAGSVTIDAGASQSFSITPLDGYHIVDVFVDGTSAGSVNTYTFNNIDADHTISATFAVDSYTITASAGDNGTISPSGTVSINRGDSKTFSISPASNYHIADVTVDGASVGAVSSYTFSNIDAGHTIQATFESSPNQPPQITSDPITAAAEGQPYSYDVEAQDPNDGDILTFTLDTAPAGMIIDSASGLIQWTPQNAQIGTHDVTVRVTDAEGLFETQAFTITVQESSELTIDITAPATYEVTTLQLPPDNTPTYIDRGYWFTEAPDHYMGLPFIRTANADKGNTSDEFLTFHVNKAVTVYVLYSANATAEPDWLTGAFTATGEQISRLYLTWNVWQAQFPAGDIPLGGNMAAGAAGNNSMYVVVIEEIPGLIAPQASFTATPTSGDAPVEVTFTDQSAGDITGWAWDFDGNGTTDSTEQNPVFTYTAAGTYTATLQVTGPGGTGISTAQITVTEPPVNEPPQITSEPVTAAVEGQTYSYDVEATDPNDADILTFSLDTAPEGMIIDSVSGLIQWTSSQPGDHDATVRVTDAEGLSDTQAFIITVTEPPSNEPPQITSEPVTAAIEDQPYNYAVEADDPNVGDTLTFSLDTAPGGMTIDSASGLIQWTPDSSQLGDHSVIVEVTDAEGLFDTQEFAITVQESGELTIDITAPATYEVATLQLPPDNTPAYIDRGYWFTEAPDHYVGLPFIRTANADKGNTSDEFLTFHVNRTVTVYVLYSASATAAPGWLTGAFTATGEQISRLYHTWNVWQSQFPAGDITLGGNMAQGAEGSGVGMYVVVIE